VAVRSRSLAGRSLAADRQREDAQGVRPHPGAAPGRDCPPPEATTAHVHAFAYGPGPSGKEPSPSTVVVRLAAVSGFYDFARRMGLMPTNPATEVKRPKLRQPTPSGLDGGELRRLLKAILNTPAGIRDRAIVLTMVLSGLRRQEVMTSGPETLPRTVQRSSTTLKAVGQPWESAAKGPLRIIMPAVPVYTGQ